MTPATTGDSSDGSWARIGSLETLELGARVEAELLSEQATTLAVDIERVGLSAAPIEREHELSAQSLPQGVGVDQRAQRRDELGMATERQQRLVAVLDRCQTELVEPLDLPLGELVEGELGEHGATPERESLVEKGDGRRRIVVFQRPVSFARKPLELDRVDLRRVAPQHVPGVSRFDHAADGAATRFEQAAQMRDVPLQCLGRRRRRPLAPERIDQHVRRDDLAATEGEDSQERSLASSRNLDLPARRVAKLERAEDPELHLTPGRRA